MLDIVHTLGNSLIPYRSETYSCPVCKTSHLGRTKRRLVDRVISQFVPVKRCRCEVCGWQGNFVRME